jgi:seryl-tRNA synthetase
VDQALVIDAQRRDLLGKADAMRSQRNNLSESIGMAIRGGADANGPQVGQLKAQSTWIGAELAGLDARLAQVTAQLDELLYRIPNPPDPGIPVGGPEASAIVRTWGHPAPHEEPQDGAREAWVRKPHWEVAEGLRMLDLAAGAKVTGSGFAFYTGAGSALQRALIDLFLDIHTREHGMTEVWPPVVVNEASARGTGQIPDKEDQMYVVGRDELYLVPTAEVPVTNIHRDEIIEAEQLPIHYVAYSPCFRREAGAAGAKTRGILRVHQFDKVEMVAFEKPADSNAALEWMVQRAEVCLQRLGLPYRVKLMATGDMGFTQAKKYDLEVWAPGVEDWLEVSSVSNFRDYQARRMAIRWRPDKSAKPEILHTLNGSGLALPRTVAALLEVYQERDGSIRIPEVLRARLGERIGP